MKKITTGFIMFTCFCVVLLHAVLIAPFEKPIVKSVGHFYIPVKNMDAKAEGSAWMHEWQDLHQLNLCDVS